MWPLRKYSEFITFPIELFNEKVQYDQVPDESAPPPKEGEKQKMKSVPRSVYEWDIMNKMKSTGLCTDICFFVHLALFVICFIQFYSTVHRPSQNSSADCRVFMTLQLFYTAPGQGLFGCEILMW